MNPIADDSQILTEPVEWPDWTIISPRRASTSSTTASTVVPAATGMRRSTSGGHRVSQSQANLRHRLLRSHNSDDANGRYGAELEETSNSTLTRQQSSPPMIAEQSTPPTSNSIMFASPAVPDSSRLPLVRVTSQITTPDNISMPTEAEKAVHKFTSLAYTACMLASLACTFLAPPKSVIKTAYMNVPIEWWGIYLAMTIFWTIWLGLHSTKQILFSTSIYVSKRISGAIATITLLAPLWNLYPLSVSAGYTISCLVTPFFHIVFHIFYTLWELYSKERAVMEKLTAKEVRAVADQGEQLLSEAEERRTASVKMITEEIRDASRIGKASIMRLAPPAVLAAYSREHLAACSIPIPTASIASVDAVLSHIEHLGKHLECLNNTTPLLDHKDSPLSGHLPQFDVGELLQRVGDMMAGCATCAKVEVVIYHAEAQICHRMVYGDETRYQHMLFNLLKMVILSAAPGDWVELGLAVTAAKPNAAKPPMGANEPHTRAINCTFRITHSPMNNDPFAISHIPNANESLKMITELNGQLVMEQKDDGLHVIDIVLPFAATSRSSPSSPSLNHGKSRTLSNGMRTSSTSCTASEPTLDELRRFISTLRNRAVALYATNRSILAKHVTAWLTLWSTDISHISTDENKTDEAELIRVSSNASFILIDDDIATLEQLLRYLCTNPTTLVKEQRPPSSRGRARSVPGNGSNESGEIVEEYPPNASASMANGHNSNHKSENGHESRSNTILVNNGRRSIIYFTSIGHYQKVKQAVADVFSNLPPFPLMTPPQVLVIPKPIGPRRFLTALHTAVTRPHMDTLSYIPIATSPATPGIWTLFNGEVEQNPMDRAMESRSVTADPRIYSGANGNTVTFNAAGTPTRPFNRSRLSQHSGGGSNTTSPMPSPNINNGGNSSNNNAALASNGGMETPPLLSPGARQSTNGLSNGSHGSLRISSSLAQSAMHTQSTPSPKVRPSSPLLPNRTSITAPSPKMPPSNLVSSSVISNGLTEKSSNGSTNTSAGIDQRPSSTRKKGVRLSNAPTLKERMNSMSTTAASKSGFVFPPIKVLIVEDNPINQTILSTFLRKRKIEYAVASDGQEAVDMWKQGGFHIVLMDIQLPVLDGIEATKEIRRFEKERKAAALPPPDSPGEVSVEQRRLATQMHTPVIIVALTASALQADRNTALAAGCNDFLTKPVSLPWLEKKITEWGCMQALINVTGWSRWRRQDSASTISTHGRGGSGAATPSPANVSRSNSEKKP